MENKLLRHGYGNNFNDIIIDDKNIIKKSKNSYGNIKIKYEIDFYKYIINNSINFPIPKMIKFGENFYTMEYLKNTVPLHQHLEDKNKEFVNTFIKKIYKKLENLHSKKIKIEKQNYFDNLKEESLIKIKKRFLEIQNIVDNLNIKKVNNICILDMGNILFKIQEYLNNFIIKKDYLSLIHGDLNFNNILVDKNNENIYFIDPRGYFGKEKLFGIEEYDYAKILFALSGYDFFDSEEESFINIENNEITFKMKTLISLEEIINKKNLETFLMITIWLGNAHCFKDNYNKCLKSYFHSMYLATIFFS